jgi:hypothetical protein
MPAAVCQLYGVAALGAAVGKNIDRTVSALRLCAEKIRGQPLAFISVRSSYDNFDILHGHFSFR